MRCLSLFSPEIFSQTVSGWARVSKVPKIACVIALFLFGMGGLLAHAQSAPAAGAASGDFGQYLVDHQADLGPFFEKNSGEFVSRSVPVLLQWLGRIMLATLIVGWVLDVVLSRGYSTLFAPAAAQLSRAFVYATGRLAMSVILTILFSLALMLVSRLGHLGVILSLLAVLFVLVAAGVQVGWIHYLYRTDLFISFLFYLTLVVIHGFAMLGISAPMIGQQASPSAKAYVDQTLAPKLEAEATETRRQLAGLAPSRDQSASEAAQLQDQIDRNKADLEQTRQAIETQKNSDGYLFSQIVKVHARGDLTQARAQFTDFLTRFPNSPLTGLAKGQLVQVTSELAAQAAQKKQEDADAVRDQAQARADLLARADRGQVTLSQMRNALIGKTRAQVSALLGPPSETASDRWGYSRQMILNPLTNEKSGLAVYFTEGVVQGVDYYAGTGGAP
jgi:TolA-binding protein